MRKAEKCGKPVEQNAIPYVSETGDQELRVYVVQELIGYSNRWTKETCC